MQYTFTKARPPFMWAGGAHAIASCMVGRYCEWETICRLRWRLEREGLHIIISTECVVCILLSQWPQTFVIMTDGS